MADAVPAVSTDSLRYVERFWSRVDRSGGPDACWVWMGPVGTDGYGKFSDGLARLLRAHRAAWVARNGPIPRGLWVLHACDNPLCCNPAHLFLGNHADNVADKMRKGRHRGPGAGARNHQAKLTAEQVNAIRQRCANGELQRVVAASYGIGQAQVSRIVNQVNWSVGSRDHQANGGAR